MRSIVIGHRTRFLALLVASLGLSGCCITPWRTANRVDRPYHAVLPAADDYDGYVESAGQRDRREAGRKMARPRRKLFRDDGDPMEVSAIPRPSSAIHVPVPTVGSPEWDREQRWEEERERQIKLTISRICMNC
jgi:hypothetical protein